MLNPTLKPDIESAGPGALVVTLLARPGAGKEGMVEQDRLAYRTVPGGVQVLAPDGLVARQGGLADPALQLRLAP